MSAETEALQAAAAQLYALLQQLKKSNVQIVHGVDVGAVNHVTIAPTPAVTAWSDDLVIVASVASPNLAPSPDLKVSDLPAIPIVLFDDTGILPGDLDGVALFKIRGTGTVEGPRAALLFLGPAAYARRFPALSPGALRPIVYDDGLNKYGGAISTANEVRAGSVNDTIVTPKALADAHKWTALADTPTVAWDMASGFNKTLSMGASRTFALPTNLKEGVPICLLITHAAANNVGAWAAGWNFGAAGAPVLSTQIGKIDMVTGIVGSVDPPRIDAAFRKG
ncbi:hypothetical protein [Methylocystis sp. S23]